jgi:hypothetical protein
MGEPEVVARVTFLAPEDGGRRHPAIDGPVYRPHIVIGDPGQRQVPYEQGHVELSAGTYLGVAFTGDGRQLAIGVLEVVRLRLLYFPEVDYSTVVAGASFTIREGVSVVGYGYIVDRP